MRSETIIVARPGNTWGLRAQREDDGTVYLAVVRPDGRGADAIPEGPLVQLGDTETRRLAELLLGPDGEDDGSAPVLGEMEARHA